jgi:protein phosphatase 1L
MGAIRRAYRRTDRKVLRKKKATTVDGEERPRRGGSTAVTVILLNGETLVVANVGDSRAVVCEAGKARQLSVDHEPLRERDAIESRGGFVTQMHGTAQLCRATYNRVHDRADGVAFSRA